MSFTFVNNTIPYYIPSAGDICYDQSTSQTLMYNGAKWCVFTYDESSNSKQLLEDLQDYIKYKNVDMSEFNDFCEAKRVVEKLSK